MTRISKRRSTKAMRAREGKLLMELQRDHGYSIGEVKPADRLGMMYSMVAGTIRAVCNVRLSVPCDSSLGMAIDASRKKSDAAPKAKRPRRATR